MVDPKEFGELTAQVEQLAKEMEEVRHELTAIKITLAEARGGWKVLMLLGGAVAGLASAVTWAVQHIKFQ